MLLIQNYLMQGVSLKLFQTKEEKWSITNHSYGLKSLEKFLLDAVHSQKVVISQLSL